MNRRRRELSENFEGESLQIPLGELQRMPAAPEGFVPLVQQTDRGDIEMQSYPVAGATVHRSVARGRPGW